MPVCVSPGGQPYLLHLFEEPDRAIAIRCTDKVNQYGAFITYEASLHVKIEDKWRSCTPLLTSEMPDADADFGAFRLFHRAQDGAVLCALNEERFGSCNYYRWQEAVMDLAKAHEAWEPSESAPVGDFDPFG